MKKIILIFVFFSFSNLFSQIIVSTIVQTISCLGSNNGAITINATGGSGNYTYSLGTTGEQSNSNYFSGLGAGSYTCTATDATNSLLTSSKTVIINQPMPLTVSVYNQENYVAIAAIGGTPPYLFSIDLVNFQPNSTYFVSQAGIYEGAVKDINGCLYYFTFTINNLESEKFEFPNLKIFPNPTSGIFNFSNSEKIDEISVFSVLGEKIFYKKVNTVSSQIDLSGISNGIYFVKFLANNHQKTIKIIKN